MDFDILKLDNLLHKQPKAVNSSSRVSGGKYPTLDDGPSHIPKNLTQKTVSSGPEIKATSIFQDKTEKSDSKDIWSVDEIEDTVKVPDLGPGKVEPKYEILYKQKVGANDVFLGLSGVTNSITDAAGLIVKIELPGVSKASELDLEVKSTLVILKSEKFYLRVDLPQTILPEKTKAKFDKATSTLRVTGLIKPSLDLL